MRNTQSRKKLTLEQRVARMYNRLPKRLKKLQTKEERKQTIRSFAAQWRLGYFDRIDPRTGKKQNKSITLRKSIAGMQPRKTDTKRIMFRRFRVEEPSLFAKYNSYMFRQGFKSTEYFMQNADVEYIGSNRYGNNLVQATLEIPVNMMGTARIRRQKVSYQYLTITIDTSGGGIENGEMDVQFS